MGFHSSKTGNDKGFGYCVSYTLIILKSFCKHLSRKNWKGLLSSVDLSLPLLILSDSTLITALLKKFLGKAGVLFLFCLLQQLMMRRENAS